MVLAKCTSKSPPKLVTYFFRVLRRKLSQEGELLMKKSRYTETQIVKILKEVEAGRLVKEV